MLYLINNKCYVNIAPSVYVEVVVSKDGKITPTKNKLEVNSSTRIETTTIDKEISKIKKVEPPRVEYEIGRKYNKRKK